MLYYLSNYLDQLDIPGAGMWSYISFRSLLALMLSLIISMSAGKTFITYMKRKRHIESARDAEIDPYGVQKKGTPSMGGIIIVGAVVIPALLLGRLDNIYINLLIITILWFGLLGFLDDYIKIVRKKKDGLKGKYKIVGQVSIGLIVGLVASAAFFVLKALLDTTIYSAEEIAKVTNCPVIGNIPHVEVAGETPELWNVDVKEEITHGN